MRGKTNFISTKQRIANAIVPMTISCQIGTIGLGVSCGASSARNWMLRSATS